MVWLYPQFLWALSALLIPIAIHLFNFRRYKRLEFSNVRLLTQINRQTKTGNQLKKYLILASRLLAFAFLVFAFAQPVLLKDKKKLENGKTSISLYIDNSYSMNLSGEEGQLLEAAKNRARAVVNSGNNSDEFNLITTDLNAPMMHFKGKQATLENIDKIKLSSASRPLSDILEIQSRMLRERSGEKMMFAISDFQKKQVMPLQKLKDSSIQQTWIKIESARHDNISIDTCYLESPILQVGQNITLVVQVSNYTENKVENMTLELWVDNKPKGLANFSIQPFSSEKQSINFTLETGGAHECVLKLPGDNIAVDDELFFSLNINRNYRIDVISDRGEKYADAVFADNPGFIYKRENTGNVNYSDFKNLDLIILQGLESIQSGFQSEIKKFVQNGGTVMVFPPVSAEPNASGLQALCAGFGINVSNEIDNTPVKVASLELAHPIYKNVFEKVPKNPDYPSLSRHLNIQANSGAAIARLSNGRPFIQVVSSGKGNFILCAAATDKTWGNFQTHALFPPTLLKSAMLGAYRSNLYQLCATNTPISTGLPFETETGISLKNDQLLLVPEVINNDGEMQLNTNGEIETQGHYAIIRKDRDSAIGSIAFNINRNESDTRTLSEDEFEKLASEMGVEEFEGSSEKLAAEFTKSRKGISLWKWCITFVLFFLLIEILLIRFFKTNAKLSA